MSGSKYCGKANAGPESAAMAQRTSAAGIGLSDTIGQDACC